MSLVRKQKQHLNLYTQDLPLLIGGVLVFWALGVATVFVAHPTLQKETEEMAKCKLLYTECTIIVRAVPTTEVTL